MSLSVQPPELLDTIASFLPLPCDLLSLALTNKTLCSVIIPQHIEFRKVCCDAQREMLWKLLTDHPALSSRILSLELRPEPFTDAKFLIPQSLYYANSLGVLKSQGSTDYSSLATAIAGMPSLQRFFLGRIIEGDLVPVFRALRNCPNLRELEITFHCQDGIPDFDSLSGPIWERKNLTLISITLTWHPGERGTWLAQMFGMLSACPQLRDLRIVSEMRGPDVDMSPLLAGQLWPDLRSLFIDGDLIFGSHTALTDFLERHPGLEALYLPERSHLPRLPLPNLRWLWATGLNTVDPALLPRLEYIAMTHVYWAAQTDIEAIIRALSAFPMLRGATLSFCTTSALRQLVSDLPRLERLVLARSPWNPDHGLARSSPWNPDDRMVRAKANRLPSAECIAILTSSVHLTHLYTSALLMGDDTDSRLDELLCALSAAPKLEYVGVDVLESGGYHRVRWFYVVRDGHGRYAGRRETLNWRKIRYHEWDDVFRDTEVEW